MGSAAYRFGGVNRHPVLTAGHLPHPSALDQLRRRLANWMLGPQPEPYVPERDTSSHTTIEGHYQRLDDEDGPNTL